MLKTPLKKVSAVRPRRRASENTSVSSSVRPAVESSVRGNPNPQAFFIPMPLSIIIGALLISASILLSGGGVKLGQSSDVLGTGTTADATLPTPQPSSSAPVIVQGVTTGDMPILGNKDAKVTVVEYADYQCPFCEQVYKQVWPQLKKDYVDTGKIQFAYRDFAFLGKPSTDPAGDESTNASNAARCANDQGAFWQYHDYLFDHQGQEDSGTFSKDNLKQFAADLGLNTTQFDQCVDNDTHVKDVQADMQAATNYGVQSTPTMFVNGLMIVGAEPYATFKAAIDQALSATQ